MPETASSQEQPSQSYYQTNYQPHPNDSYSDPRPYFQNPLQDSQQVVMPNLQTCSNNLPLPQQSQQTYTRDQPLDDRHEYSSQHYSSYPDSQTYFPQPNHQNYPPQSVPQTYLSHPSPQNYHFQQNPQDYPPQSDLQNYPTQLTSQNYPSQTNPHGSFQPPVQLGSHQQTHMVHYVVPNQ
jgi:hypothetical protein